MINWVEKKINWSVKIPWRKGKTGEREIPTKKNDTAHGNTCTVGITWSEWAWGPTWSRRWVTHCFYRLLLLLVTVLGMEQQEPRRIRTTIESCCGTTGRDVSCRLLIQHGRYKNNTLMTKQRWVCCCCCSPFASSSRDTIDSGLASTCYCVIIIADSRCCCCCYAKVSLLQGKKECEMVISSSSFPTPVRSFVWVGKWDTLDDTQQHHGVWNSSTAPSATFNLHNSVG